MTNLESLLKNRDITLPIKAQVVKAMVFPVVMWELDHKENWALKNWCFWSVMLENTLESLLDCKIKPVNPSGNQPWIFIGRTDGWSWSSNTLVTWCKEPAHWERLCCWAKGEGGGRGWDVRIASLTQWTWMDLSKLQEMVKDRRAWHPIVHGITKSQIGLSDWTTATNIKNLIGKQCKCILLSVFTEGNIYLWGYKLWELNWNSFEKLL